MSRMQFLRGEFRQGSAVIRPPWALAEDRFIESCSRCKQCVDKCPEKIIVKGRGGFPEIDFSRGECSFCAVCLDHCSDHALDRNTENDASPWTIKALVGDTCLALQGVVCVTCKEQCDARAIEMKHQRGAVAIPFIDNFLCTGCGACYQPCPVNAISLQAADFPEDIEV